MFAKSGYLSSSFKSWMETQDWEGKQLDKDLLFEGNRVYSPETCVFVTVLLMVFIVESDGIRGDYPIGVHFDKENMKFAAQCKDPFTKKQVNLGRYTCPQEAHLAWKKRKHELACKLAEEQTDERVANILRTKYI